jgi:hypothetical protein
MASMETLLAAGTTVADRYRVGFELGRGGYSIVYQGYDQALGSDVALKLLVPPPAAARLAEQRLRREVLAVRALEHPHIVRIFELVEHGPWLLVVMELVRGGDLEAWVRTRGPLSSDEVAKLGCSLAEALGAAHRRGIVHRDLKPHNVLLTPDGQPKLADFGAARIDGLDGLTQTGMLVGTREYAAPELLIGGRGDGRSDVYSLGRTLRFAATGRGGPERERPTSNGWAAAGVAPGSLAPWLEEVLATATCDDPGGRYMTAAELGAALAQAGDPVSVALAAPESSLRAVAASALGPGGGRGVARRRGRGAKIRERAECVACGSANVESSAPGPVLCACCALLGPAEGSGDQLVVIEQPRATKKAAEQLAALLRISPARQELNEVLVGKRVLACTSGALATRMAARLTGSGLAVRVVPAAKFGRLPSRGFAWMVGAVAAVGFASALVVPWLLVSTAVLVGLLLSAGARQSAEGMVALPSTTVRALPMASTEALLSAAADLPPGLARSLLAELVQRVDLLAATASTDSRPDVGPLVERCCSAARELSQLEQTLDRVGRGVGSPGANVEAAFDEQLRYGQLRDRLTQRLLEAIAAVGVVALRRFEGPDSTSAQLSDATRELEEELSIRVAADRELHQLVGRV